tara:strand:+ start:4768 stop:5661 length:894 start_codon:yes stop_codon:yes gene_type:complete
MAKYTPKSKISIQEAGPGEFILKKTRKPYVGPYIETSGRKFFAGSNPKKLSLQLIKPVSIPNNFGKNRNTAKYNVLNKKTYSKLKKSQNIVATKNKPTEDDYKAGRYTRYFIKKVNELYGYFEVDKKTYHSINKKEPKYNHPMYDVGQIVWSLVGNVKKHNKAQTFLQRDKYPNLNVLFSKLDEFAKIEDRLIENLSTSGGELYYKDGREYKGPYHIHPGKGPMVGAKHISGPHETLFYEQSEDTLQSGGDIILGKSVTSLNEIAPEYTILSPTTPSTPSTSVTTGGSTSGGGGGGY